MGEAAEFRRQLAALEASFLRPERAPIDELAASLNAGAARTGPELWQRAAERGVIPASLVDDPRRGFRASVTQLAALGQTARCVGEWRAPPSKQAALLFAADPEGMLRAEALAREVARRLEAWGGPAVERVVWWLNGHAQDNPGAKGPPLGLLREPVARLLAVLGGPRRVHEVHHAHPRFQHVVDRLTWAGRLRHLADDEVPAEVMTAAGRVGLAPELVGRALAELPDPLAPWLELIAMGYDLWSVWAPGQGPSLYLAAPFGPRRDPGRQGAHVAPTRPRAVWSARTSALRLAAARGDLGALRQLLPLHPRVFECGEPPLTSYAVYGGRHSLAVLAEHGWLELESRDASGKTPLMMAASLPSAGPVGGLRAEIDVPRSTREGAAACRYLVERGADLEARDGEGRTALHWGVDSFNIASVDALLVSGAAVDAQDYRGRTPLMLALELAPGMPPELIGSLEPHEAATEPIVERLLDAKPDTDIRDEQGWTVLHVLAREAAGAVPPTLLRRLRAGGVVPSRDRRGASPADICARCYDRRHRDGGPFDPRTAVAAGPGPRPRLRPPAKLVARLVDGVREARASRRATRAQLDDWLVWADWLQGQGDPRGELVATSVARAGLGGAARRRFDARVAELEGRCVVALEQGLEPLVHGLTSGQVRMANAGALPRIERTHGFVTAADLHVHGDRSAHEILRAARCLLAHEPVLTTLMIGPHIIQLPGGPVFDWAELLTGMAELEPHAGVRELVLRGLPLRPVAVAGLERCLPGVRAVSLFGHLRLAGVSVRWPGLTHLRLSHGRRARGENGSEFDFELELPDLERLDLMLPARAHYPDSRVELASMTEALERLPALRHLRIRGVTVALLVWLADSKLLRRLSSLEIDAPSPTILTTLYDWAAVFDRVERLRLVSEFDQGPDGTSLERVRARLPKLEHVVVRPRPRRPAKW